MATELNDEIGLAAVGATKEDDRICDVVFVHGLGGGSQTTWAADAKADKFWPAWLAEDFPNADFWTLGYGTTFSVWKERSMPLADLGSQILEELSTAGIGRRPVVFVTHSMGGLVVKQILSHAQSQGVPRWEGIVKQTRGIAFLATPHSGANLANFAEFTGIVLRASDQVSELRQHSSRLRELHGTFLNFVNRYDPVCRTFAERLEVKPGVTILKWNVKVPKGILVVDATSAEPNIPGERAIPLDEDHLSICKPPDRNAQVHKYVRSFLEDCIQKIANLDSLSEKPSRKEDERFFPPDGVQEVQAVDDVKPNQVEAENCTIETSAGCTASILTSTAVTQLEKGETFAGLHNIARAISCVPDQPLQQAANRIRLGVMQQVTPKLVAILEQADHVQSVNFSCDGDYLVATDYYGPTRIWAMGELDRPPMETRGHYSWQFDARFNRNSDICASMISKATDGLTTFGFWSASRSEQVAELGFSHFPIEPSELSVFCGLLAARDKDEVTAIVDGKQSHPRLEILPNQSIKRPSAMIVDPQGRFAAVSSHADTFVWELSNGRQLCSIRAGQEAAFRPNHRQLAIGNGLGEISLWDLDTGKCSRTFTTGGHVTFLTFDDTGDQLLGLSQGDNPRIWNLKNTMPNAATILPVKEWAYLSRFPRTAFRGEFVCNGYRVLTWQGNTVRLWDCLTGRTVWTIQGHVGGDMTGHVSDAAMTHDGRWLATASADKTLRLWEIPNPAYSYFKDDNNKESESLPTQDNEKARSTAGDREALAREVCLKSSKALPDVDEERIERFSPDGTLKVEFGSDESSIRLIDVGTDIFVCELKGHENVIHGVRFSPTGQRIVTYSGGDDTARIWKREHSGSYTCMAMLVEEDIHSCAFNSAGSLLALATHANTVTLWDLEQCELILRVLGQNGRVSNCDFDQLGRLVAAFRPEYHDKSKQFITVWDLKPLSHDAAEVQQFIESYTGSKLAVHTFGGVNGLSNREWQDRRQGLKSS